MSTDLGITFSGLFSAILFGAVGMWLFARGKKNLEYRNLFIGLALMIYPYFTHGAFQDWGVGVALCALAYYYR